MIRDGASPNRSALQALLLAALCTIAAGVIVGMSRYVGAVRPDFLYASGITFAFFTARLLTIRLPRGDEVNATLVVGLVGLALVNVHLLVISSIVAGLADAAARYSGASRPTALYRLLDALRGAAVLAILSPWQLVLHPLATGSSSDWTIVWSVLAGATYALLDLFTVAVQQSASGGMSLGMGLASLARPLGTVYVVHVPLAAVVLRMQTVSRLWPFAIAVLLTLILQNSFNLYLRIRRAYAETIGALAHAAELDRPHDSGHSRRVADLSVAVGRRLSLSSRQLEMIGYAALLHDIGRMGAAGDGFGDEHACRGAEIAAAIPFLAEVAPLISPTTDEHGRFSEEGVIVRLCSRYDRLRVCHGAIEALQILRREETGQDRVLDLLEDVVGIPLRNTSALP